MKTGVRILRIEIACTNTGVRPQRANNIQLKDWKIARFLGNVNVMSDQLTKDSSPTHVNHVYVVWNLLSLMPTKLMQHR